MIHVKEQNLRTKQVQYVLQDHDGSVKETTAATSAAAESPAAIAGPPVSGGSCGGRAYANFLDRRELEGRHYSFVNVQGNDSR